MLPADIVGTRIYRGSTEAFDVELGPIFVNFVLADEINRAPAKVQSALLEAMAERQVSIGRQSYPLPEMFLVMATQNPIEQEGTYPLPEAQLDRFLMHVSVGYPNLEAEREILTLARREAKNEAEPPPAVLSLEAVMASRREVMQIHMSPGIDEYIVQLVMASRDPRKYSKEMANWIEYGGSPRATIAMDRCARSLAWLKGRDFVSPDDVQEVVHDVLRHRLILSFEAEANGVTKDQVIDSLLQYVPVV
ncbi:MAG: AAA family ATPase, partial [Desulfurivibrionaceae bacterium]